MNVARRDVLRITMAAVGCIAAPPLALSQSWPERPVRVVVPFAPGGTDVVFRLLGQKLSDLLGQQFYVENIAGAGSSIGTEHVKRAPADGYTLLATAPGFVTYPALHDKVRYDPLNDFAPVTLVATTSLVLLVDPSLPVKSLQELVALVKANPGKYSYASAGVGTPPHLTGELLRQSLGLDLVHVPYSSGGQAVGSVIAGHTPICFAAVGPAAVLIREGKLRALAVAGATRLETLPGVPTTAEAGYPGVVGEVWCGILMPGGTSGEIIAKLHEGTVKSLAFPDVKARLTALGYAGIGSTPHEFRAELTVELAKWTKVIKTAGIKA